MERLDDEILIQRFIDKNLDAEELKKFKDRYEKDEDFRQTVNDYANLIIPITASEKIINEKKMKTIKIKKYAIAASLLIIIGLSSIIYILNYNPKEEYIADKTVFNISPDILQTENFLPNPTLENSVKTNYRSKLLKLDVIIPTDSSIFVRNETINFKIKSISNKSFTVVIYNNKLRKVHEFFVSNNTYAYQSQLTPGVYYWKMQFRSESVWGGRFFILP